MDPKIRRLVRNIRFVSENITTISAALIFLGIALSCAYIAGYALIFGYVVLELIEYSDIINIGIFTICLLGGAFVSIAQARDLIFDLNKFIFPYRLRLIVLATILIALTFLLLIFTNRFSITIFIFIMFLLIISLSFIDMLRIISSLKLTSMKALLDLEFLLSLHVVAFGLGSAIALFANFLPVTVDVQIKGRGNEVDTIKGANIILRTSHDTAFKLANKTIIVPTSDILRMTGGTIISSSNR